MSEFGAMAVETKTGARFAQPWRLDYAPLKSTPRRSLDLAITLAEGVVFAYTIGFVIVASVWYPQQLEVLLELL